MSFGDMVEALEWAADYADRNKLFEPVVNSRGYADGWKPPTPAEKAQVITKLARDAMPDTSVREAELRRFLREGVLHNLDEALVEMKNAGSSELLVAREHITAIASSVHRYLGV